MRIYTLKHFSLFLLISLFLACTKDKDSNTIPIPNTVSFEPILSAYQIFDGDMKLLQPSSAYHEVELSSHLFVNYAKKQRLIKVPDGTKLKKLDQGLPEFPEGTIIVKTFYYYHDETNPSLGKQIIETRLLIKQEEQWNVATYIWNTEQTEAYLKNNGQSKTISWVNKQGVSKTITYEVPSQEDCATCHQFAGEVAPIGPQLSNMNIEVTRNGMTINQLEYFQSIGIMDQFDHTSIPVMPDYFDETFTLEERGRAYFELNCAHCHNPEGFCSQKSLDFRYITPIGSTNIINKKGNIVKKMDEGQMPLIGISTLDEEGILLVKNYLISL